MGKIHMLDKNISELIAAGEVIERPASIVKELLENSLDAQATAVTIEIRNGGIDFIRITDNGIGFLKEDAALAFFRHATSKVSEKNDLDNIATLGFRGEALASVAAVSKIELESKTSLDEFGIKLFIDGGKVINQSEVGTSTGTTIMVKSLFYNVPARLKFLKKPTAESNAIQSIVEKIALSHPNVSFKFIRDNKQTVHTAGDGKLISAIYSVLGREFANSLIEVAYEYQGVKINGYITKPSFSKNNRVMQHFFVNTRYVKSGTCLTALEEGYKNSIMVGKFPGAVLMVELGYSLVDVNVHPAKIEIRFADEKTVFEAIYFAVKSALSKADILKSSVDENKNFPVKRIFPVADRESMQLNIQSKSVANVPTNKQMAEKAENSFTRMTADEYKVQFALAPEKHSLRSKQVLPNFQSLPQVEELPKRAVAQKAIEPATEEVKESFSFLSESSFEKKADGELKVSKTSTRVANSRPQENDCEPIKQKFIGELFRTYILFEVNDMFIMLDKHAAHERILFEQLKASINLNEHQLLLVPTVVSLSTEEIGIIEGNQKIFSGFGFKFDFSKEHSVGILEAPLILHSYNLAEIVQDITDNIKVNKFDAAPKCFEDLLHSIACKMAIKANMDTSAEELKALAEQVYLDDKIRHCPHGRPVGITMTKTDIEKKFGRI